MRPMLFSSWLLAVLPLILAECLPPEMIVNPGVPQRPPQKRSTTPFLNPFTPTWNDKVPEDTLIISGVVDSTQSRATVGYKGVNKGRRPHELVVGHKSSAAVIAHEMGHGDNYVRFNCHNVRGFDDALDRATSMRIPPAEAQRRLCEDREFATQYGFDSPAFIENELLSSEPGRWGALDEPGGYDVDSTMHYASYAFGDLDACLASRDHCSLLRIEKDKQGSEIGTRLIGMPKRPSSGDVAWVKKNYCWPADADCN